MDLSPAELETRRIMKQSLDEVYLKEELYWKQSAKFTWLAERDKELLVLPQGCIREERKNCIASLLVDGTKLNNLEDIGVALHSFIKNLFRMASKPKFFIN